MIVYAKKYLSLLSYLSFWTLINVNGFLHNEVVCGFPGTPANGQINFTKESYKIGEQVSFFCDEGYERQGPPVNTCNNEGLWRNDLPLCLQNLAFKRLASQSSTENDFVASLAVDGNKLTCAETKFNNKTYNNIWSVQLDQEYTIDRIELKAQLANSYAQFNLSIQVMKSQDEKYFQICTRIQPRKGITSFEDSIQCGSGYRDIIGSVIRIVDLRLTRGKLKLCEVKVFAKQRYKCGKADLQPNCEVKYFEKNGLQHAEYHPKTNYQLVKGSNLRVCTNGKWSSNSPLCIDVVCGFPGTPANGKISIRKESYKIGEEVSFYCNEGYERFGPAENVCNNEGIWKDDLPLCLQDVAHKRLAQQTSTESDFVASLAVDGNKLTCAQTKLNNNTNNNNVWWVQLDQEYLIETVQLKAQLANSYSQFNLSIQVLKSRDLNHFQSCANILLRKGITTYEGTIQCIREYQNISGSVIRIVDLRISKGRLKLCDVKVFAEQKFRCGEPDVKPNCEVKYFERNGIQQAEYNPKKNYQLIKGSKLRACENGKWTLNAPLCVELRLPYSNSSSRTKDIVAIEILCGFPGTPANGHIDIRKESYKIGEQVSFYCNDGYEKRGPPVNTCNNEGLWNNELPFCVQDVAHKRLAQQTSTESDFVASLAVDGNKFTCAETKFNNKTYNNMWWVELDQEYTIDWIELKAQLGRTTYEGTIQCSREYQTITGSVIRIVDLRLTRGRLKLCDVKVFAKQKFRCGEPDVKPNCGVKYYERNGIQQAEYNPKTNYQLIKGSKLRACKNGKWTSKAPSCIETKVTGDSNSLSIDKDVTIVGIAVVAIFGNLNILSLSVLLV